MYCKYVHGSLLTQNWQLRQTQLCTSSDAMVVPSMPSTSSLTIQIARSTCRSNIQTAGATQYGRCSFYQNGRCNASAIPTYRQVHQYPEPMYGSERAIFLRARGVRFTCVMFLDVHETVGLLYGELNEPIKLKTSCVHSNPPGYIARANTSYNIVCARTSG